MKPQLSFRKDIRLITVIFKIKLNILELHYTNNQRECILERIYLVYTYDR